MNAKQLEIVQQLCEANVVLTLFPIEYTSRSVDYAFTCEESDTLSEIMGQPESYEDFFKSCYFKERMILLPIAKEKLKVIEKAKELCQYINEVAYDTRESQTDIFIGILKILEANG